MNSKTMVKPKITKTPKVANMRKKSFKQFFKQFFPECYLSHKPKKGNEYVTYKEADEFYQDFLDSGLTFKEYDTGSEL